jgi:hypothetical protein
MACKRRHSRGEIVMGDVINEQVLGTVRKNRGQVVRVSVGDYAGCPYVYARVYPIEESPEPIGHPGLTLRADTVRDLIPLLSQALELAEIREKASFDQEPEERRRRRR